MESISNMSLHGVYAPPSVKQKEASPVQEEQKTLNANAVRDTYSPTEQPEPSGRYWMEQDETGQPKIYFDDPDKKSPDEKTKAESCTGDTSKVDREIERLKKQQEALSQQLHTETDEAKIKELERKLEQVRAELQQKDNDTYRRQHTVFS